MKIVFRYRKRLKNSQVLSFVNGCLWFFKFATSKEKHYALNVLIADHRFFFLSFIPFLRLSRGNKDISLKVFKSSLCVQKYW